MAQRNHPNAGERHDAANDLQPSRHLAKHEKRNGDREHRLHLKGKRGQRGRKAHEQRKIEKRV